MASKSKKMPFRLLSVGLLASSGALSTTPTVVNAQEVTTVAQQQTQATTESVKVITTDSTTESKESMTASTTTHLSDAQETTETSTGETPMDGNDSTDTTTEATSETSSSTESSSQSTDSATTTTTSESSTSSSSSTSQESTTTSSTTGKTSEIVTSSSTQTSSSSQGNQATVETQPTVEANVPGNTSDTITNQSNSLLDSGETTFHISPNYTTKAFVKVIGEDARKIAGTSDVYASVMIAQAILESASGNSALAAAPNYNLFGIKGSYQGASVNFLTSEDNGSGKMYTIRSNFRKYPSYKESLKDYVQLIRGGVDASNHFYSGTWKSNTHSYQEATKFLTGRYATDTSYYAKLNALIEAYKLTEYDTVKDEATKETPVKTTVTTPTTTPIKKAEAVKNTKVADYAIYVVKKGDSLRSISELYNISTLAILEKNQMERRMIFVGQKLQIPKEEDTNSLVKKEEIINQTLAQAQKISNAFTKNTQTNSGVKVKATRTKTETTYEVKKSDSLASISQKTGVSIPSLKEWNQLDQYFLTEGQLLNLTNSNDWQ